MASIKIYEDQENQTIGGRNNKQVMAGQQKRTVLGVIDNNQIRDRQIIQTKPGLSLRSNENTQCSTSSSSNTANHENVPKPNLALPLAQFEAFKVYEDNMRLNGGKPKIPNVDELYKHSKKIITKKELMIMAFGEEKKNLTAREFNEIIKNRGFGDGHDYTKNEDSPLRTPSPMNISVEKKENKPAAIIELQPKSVERDRFFLNEEYRKDIYLYLREHELRHRPKAGYMKKQPDITYNMRTILVDWLVEVALEYKLQTETLYLAVNFIDRFLSYMSVVRAKLQLVGTAAMFIAAKYEEIYPPDVSEFVYITDDTYNKRQVIRMEHLILKVLGFDLSIPTPLTFITAMCSATDQPDKVLYLAMYLSEMSLLEADPYLEFLPSMIAASAIAVARHTFELNVWPDVLVQSTGYELKHLQKCIEFLQTLHEKASSIPQHAIQDKYKDSQYLQVASVPVQVNPFSFE